VPEIKQFLQKGSRLALFGAEKQEQRISAFPSCQQHRRKMFVAKELGFAGFLRRRFFFRGGIAFFAGS